MVLYVISYGFEVDQVIEFLGSKNHLRSDNYYLFVTISETGQETKYVLRRRERARNNLINIMEWAKKLGYDVDYKFIEVEVADILEGVKKLVGEACKLLNQVEFNSVYVVCAGGTKSLVSALTLFALYFPLVERLYIYNEISTEYTEVPVKVFHPSSKAVSSLYNSLEAALNGESPRNSKDLIRMGLAYRERGKTKPKQSRRNLVLTETGKKILELLGTLRCVKELE